MLRSLPLAHRVFLERAMPILRDDVRIVGVAAGGSYASDSMDEHSDLDLVIAVEPEHVTAVMAKRADIAGALGPLLGAFTGEHVGEPRLLICLYGPQALHVDLKFVELSDVSTRVEDPIVLWERDGRVTAALAQGTARHPQPDPQWIEDRFWIWIHYGSSKVARGELFEAMDSLAFLRMVVFGPLMLRSAGARPQGVRRIEHAAPALADRLLATVAQYDAHSCLRAFEAAVGLYRELRPATLQFSAAESAAVEHLAATRLSLG
ncbi:MAG: nucleotidyltransferase domain-containing protein [Vicinamibacterales bacterium]